VIVSPYVLAGSVIPPPGSTPFDHTSIHKTLQDFFGVKPLTPRSATPSLLSALSPTPGDDGPESVTSGAVAPVAADVAELASRPPNDLQHGLSSAAAMLPRAGADVAAHIRRMQQTVALPTPHPTVADAAIDVAAHVKAFLGR
jgi:phospholipase C